MLDREALTDTTLDQFIIAGDMTAWGPMVRTLVAEVRSLRTAASEVIEMFADARWLVRSDIPWPSLHKLADAVGMSSGGEGDGGSL